MGSGPSASIDETIRLNSRRRMARGRVILVLYRGKWVLPTGGTRARTRTWDRPLRRRRRGIARGEGLNAPRPRGANAPPGPTAWSLADLIRTGKLARRGGEAVAGRPPPY